MIMITTRQVPPPPDQRIDQRPEPAAENPAERAAEQATEYVFATADGRWEVHVVRRGVRAWAVRLGGFTLHRDGCFWPAPTDQAAHQPHQLIEPTYPLDEAIARTLHVLVRLP